MSQETFGQEGEIEEDGGDTGAGDEERLEGLGAHVGYICDILRRIHGWIVWFSGNVPMDEEAHEHA